MAAAETARLIASLELQDKNFTRGIRNVERGVGRVDKKLGAFSGFVNRNMGRAIDSIGVRLVSSIGQGLEELATLEDATTSVTGAINQVGLAGKVSADQIATWANEIEGATDAAFDDKAIVQATTTLIRYGKVTEKNIRPAMEIITDLAAKTGDVESASVLLAKALADPAKAAGKLARQGVILTKAQQKQIKAMVKVNDVAGAQNLLLEILSDTTEGAAKASAGPYRDALNKLGDAGEDLRRSFAVGLLPVIEEVSSLLTTELAKPETLSTLKGIGSGLADTLRSIIGIARQLPWEQIGASLKLAGTGAKAVLDAFLGLPPWIQTAVLTGWGLNKLTGGALSGIVGSLASGLIKGVLGINAGVVNLTAGTIAGIPGGAAGGSAPVAAAGKLARVANAVKILGAVTIAGASIALLAQQIGTFVEGVGRDQKALQEKVNATTRQGFKETVANLEATSAGISKLSGLDEILASVTGGGQITENFEMAADRIVKAQGLTRTDTLAALRALSAAQKQARELNLKTPGLDAAIVTLTNRLNAERQATTNAINNAKSIASRENDATRQKVADVAAKAQATANAVKNAQSIASRENSAQKAELSNIKNVTVTGDAQQKAAIIAQTAINAVGNMLSIGQSASQVLAAGSTTSAVNINASATRGVAPPITSAIYSIGASIRAAIFAARPVIQSTNVVNNYTRTQRTGATSGSRNGTSYSGYR
jgi:hypothetical protein